MQTSYDKVFLPSFTSPSNFQRLTLREALEHDVQWLTKHIATLISFNKPKMWENSIIEAEHALAYAEMRLMTLTSNSAPGMKALYLKAEIDYELIEWN